VLLVDLRGHGRSKKIDYENLKRYTFDKIGDDVMEVLDYLQIKKTHFVGISLGTIIIREITERFPNRTISMVLGGAVMKLNVRGQILMRLGALLQSVVPYLVLYKLLAFVIMPRKKHKESRNLFINEAKKLYQREFKRWFTLVSEVNPLLNLFRIKDSGVPTLYIMGEEDYMFLPSIKQLVKNHVSSQLFVIPACGHVVNVEKPDEFNRQAIYFLQNYRLN
jgi:pimeloyl-ACP methyl ester carboxylesterase